MYLGFIKEVLDHLLNFGVHKAIKMSKATQCKKKEGRGHIAGKQTWMTQKQYFQY